ncbi:MAG: RNA polymerase sigma factor, partial [Chloroflexota bacterium]
MIPEEGKPALPGPLAGDSPAGNSAGGAACNGAEGATELIQAECVDYRGQAPSIWTAPAADPGVEVLGGSFTGVVDRYQAPLISFLFGMVGSREQAEDLAQDTLIKAYAAMERRRAGQQFTAGWLFRIARNTAIDALR